MYTGLQWECCPRLFAKFQLILAFYFASFFFFPSVILFSALLFSFLFPYFRFVSFFVLSLFPSFVFSSFPFLSFPLLSHFLLCFSVSLFALFAALNVFFPFIYQILILFISAEPVELDSRGIGADKRLSIRRGHTPSGALYHGIRRQGHDAR
jgi:hypothetical protein